MGTNYYAEKETCPTCGHSKQKLHIGKSSGGWSFSFQAYKDYDSWDNKPITSYKRWVDILSEPNVIIKNEYNEIVKLQEFCIMVESKRNQTKHAEYVRGELDYIKYHPDEDFLDPEGHSFSYGEFS